MEPDDAADLLGELTDEQAEQFLTLMEPDDAEDVRTLLSYDEHTAGGLMTTEPVILTPETTVAEALADVDGVESIAVSSDDSPSGSIPLPIDAGSPFAAATPTVVDGRVLLQATLVLGPAIGFFMSAPEASPVMV